MSGRLLVGIAVVVIGVLAGAYVYLRAPAGGTESRSQGQGQNQGQAVTVGGVEFTLLDTQCSASNVGTPGYTWVGFQVRARNASPAIFQEPPYPHWLASSDGQWSGDGQDPYNNGWPTTWEPLLGSWFSSLDPGQEETGWFVFKMPIAKDHIAFGYAPFLGSFGTPPSAWTAEWDTHCP